MIVVLSEGSHGTVDKLMPTVDVFQPCPESVPHHIAVQNRKVLLSSAESREGLTKQVRFTLKRVFYLYMFLSLGKYRAIYAKLLLLHTKVNVVKIVSTKPLICILCSFSCQ